MSKSLAQLLKYALVGVSSNLAGYAIYLLVTSLGTPPKLAMTCLYAIGAALGYIGNRQLTFSHNGSLSRSVLRYALVHCLGYLLNLSILVVFVDHLHWSHAWVQGAAVLIVAGMLFLMFKFFAFSGNASPERS